MDRRLAAWSPERPRERRSERWLDLPQVYPRVVVAATLALAALLVLDAWLLYKRWSYKSEIRRLRAALSSVEHARADRLLAAPADRYELQIELMRRLAQDESQLNLAVVADEGKMYLQQGRAQLRSMRIQLGAEYPVGTAPGAIRSRDAGLLLLSAL